jgi:hypothetical protein
MHIISILISAAPIILCGIFYKTNGSFDCRWLLQTTPIFKSSSTLAALEYLKIGERRALSPACF